MRFLNFARDYQFNEKKNKKEKKTNLYIRASVCSLFSNPNRCFYIKKKKKIFPGREKIDFSFACMCVYADGKEFLAKTHTGRYNDILFIFYRKWRLCTTRVVCIKKKYRIYISAICKLRCFLRKTS